MIVFWVLLALVMGACVALQGSINTAASARIGGGTTLLLTSIFMLIGSLGLLFYHSEAQKWTSTSFTETPWYLYLGGPMGFTIVFLAILLFPRLGAGATLAITITSQLVMAVIIDHFGLFDAPISPVSWVRVLGVLMLIGGAALVKLF